MSLTAAQADIYRRLGFPASPDPTVVARLLGFLNEAQQDVLGRVGGQYLVHGTITFASIANQIEYGLPPSVARVITMRDIANNINLRQIGESEYKRFVPDAASNTGTPTAYAKLGLGFVQARPSTADAILVISDSASDTTQTVNVEMIDSNGRVITTSATLNGTTAVSLAASGIVEVSDFYLSAVAVGTVTLRQTTGAGTVLSTIYPSHLREVYQRIALVLTPASALTYTVDYERDATDLVNSTDEFPVPPRFRRVMVTKAVCYEYENSGDVTRFAMADRRYEKELGELNNFLVNAPDQLWVPDGVTPTPSNLPSAFPTSGYGRY